MELKPIKADQVHQNPWKSIKHGSTGSPKKVPKTASIECCARPLVPQVMKVCFILVLGHRYETCTLVFYRGVLKKKVAQSALMPHYSIEKMVSKKTCAPPFYRGCFAGGACTPTIYIYKMGGAPVHPLNSQGDPFCLSTRFLVIFLDGAKTPAILGEHRRHSCPIFWRTFDVTAARLLFWCGGKTGEKYNNALGIV